MHSSVLDPKIKTLAVKYCVSMESGKVWYLEGHFFLFFIFLRPPISLSEDGWRIKMQCSIMNYELSSSRAYQDAYHTNLTCSPLHIGPNCAFNSDEKEIIYILQSMMVFRQTPQN